MPPVKTDKVAIISPEGEYGYVPQHEYEDALASGYSAPTPEQTRKQQDLEYYSQPLEQARTFVESAAKSATLGLSTGLQVAAGVDPAEITARKEANPNAAIAGDVAGVVAPTLLGGGLLQAGGRAVMGSAAKVGVGKLGQRVAREAAEGAIYQAGDEVSKAFLRDPNQTSESIAGNIGISSVLSGGMGAAFHGGEKLLAPLWTATKGAQLSKLITKVKDRTDGISGVGELDDLARQAGFEIDPAIKASMSEEGAPLAANLREAATPSGRKYQSQLEAFYKDASDNSLAAIGRTPKDIANISELSAYEQGVSVRDALSKEIDTIYAPVAKEYDSIKKAVEGKTVPAESIPVIQDRLARLAIESGSAVRPGSDEALMMKSIMKDIQNVKTLQDFEIFQSSVNADMGAKQMFSLRSKVMKELRDQEEMMIGQTLGKDAPQLIESYADARAGYRDMMDKIDLLSDRLRPGRFSGPKGFITALKEMSPEDVLRRMDVAKDVDLAKHLTQNFPEALRGVKDAKLNDIVKKAALSPRAVEGSIDMRVLHKQLDALSPEMRDLLLAPEQKETLSAIRRIVESTPERINPSGTAKALDGKLSALGGGSAGLVFDLMTGSPGVFTLLGATAKLLGRDVPDATKLAILKVIGTDGPVDAVAFKALVSSAEQAYKAAKAMKAATKAVLKPGAGRIAEALTTAELKDIDKEVQLATESPEHVMEKVSQTSSYLPDHAVATGAMASNVVNYLSKLRPKTGGVAPLDPQRKPNAVEQARYERALSIAERPALVLQAVKDGSLTPNDIMDIGTMYPALYNQYKSMVMEQIAESQDKGIVHPYKQIVSLGLFMQMPLESSTQPGNMAANQALQMSLEANKQNPTQGGLEQLGDGVKTNLTQNQARRMERLKP